MIFKRRGIELRFRCDGCGRERTASRLCAPGGWAEIMIVPNDEVEHGLMQQVCSDRCMDGVVKSATERMSQVVGDRWEQQDRDGVERTPLPDLSLRFNNRFGLVPWPHVRERWRAEDIDRQEQLDKAEAADR